MESLKGSRIIHDRPLQSTTKGCRGTCRLERTDREGELEMWVGEKTSGIEKS